MGRVIVIIVLLSVTQSSLCQNRPQEVRTFDIFSTINSLRSNILSILGTPFNSNNSPQQQPRPRPPPPPPRPATFNNQIDPSFNQPPPPPRPSPPRQPPPPRPQTFTQGVFTSSGPQPLSQTFFSSQPQPQPQPQPSQPQPFQAGFSSSPFNENPIVEVSNTFDNANIVQSENLILPTVEVDNNNISPVPAPVPENVGPATFIDSDRVNAGLSDNSEIEVDDNLLSHIPHDLWREDVDGIKHQKKIRVIKRKRSVVTAKRPETATQVFPELLVG